jgi:citrate synthase
VFNLSQEKPVIYKGLENIYMDESSICFIDGFHSKLYYRGYSIEDLAANSTYEEVTYLLFYGRLPKRKELEDFKGWLKENREIPNQVIELIKKIPKDTHPMEVLRTVVSYLGNLDPGRSDLSLDGMYRKSIRLTAKMPTIIAAYHRIRTGREIIDPDPKLDHSANFLYMLHGEKPSELWARTMDVSNILYAEHEMNASAFASVVVASTLSDYYSAIVAGIGALRGPLHGGANEEAMKQFLEIGSPDKVDEWFNNAVAQKKRIMGCGHRVYKSYDPRAKIFKEYAKKFADMYGGELKSIYEVADKLEKLVIDNLAAKNIFPNVDYWSGIPYYGMKIPIDLYTPLFALSRVAGWSAHIIEYVTNNRILRPRLYYTGELNKPYIPIDQR